MSAAIQNQIRLVEQKLKPYLHQGPLASPLSFIEKKTKLRREHIAFGIPFL